MRQFFIETKNYIHKNIRSLVLFEILYKSVFLILMVPFFSWSLQRMLRIAGYSYLTIDNIASFLKSPFTIIYAFFLLVLLSLFMTVQMISLIIYCFSCINNRKIGVTQIIVPSFYKAYQLVWKKKNVLLPFFCIMEAFVIGFPLIYNVIRNMRIPSYIIKTIFNYKGIVFGLVIIFAVILIVSFRGIFAIHFCVLEDRSLKEAYRESIKLEQGHRLQILSYLFFWNLILVIGYLILYFFAVLITGLIIYFSVDPTVVVVVFLRLLEQINRYIVLFIVIVTFIANFGIITKLFVTYKVDKKNIGYEIEKLQEIITDARDEERLETSLTGKRSIIAKGRYFRIIMIVTIIVVSFNAYYLLTGFYKSAFIETNSLFGTYVTAHRGASMAAPENTMEALSAAIDMVSDYAEIDVQETKDGIVVLMHDSNLKRTCGVKKNIWDVTYEELLTYDAGSSFSKEFAGTKVPTLEEVLEFCSGKIKLNIEIKITSHQQNLVEKVVALIDAYDFERQCVVSSTNYSALAKVKELNENIKTGYILSLAYGYFYNSEYADFFSVKSSFINESMVRVAHSLGKEVHAWTINSKTEVERMKQLGVDNIITDEPLMAKEIIYSESSVATFKELLETLINSN